MATIPGATKVTLTVPYPTEPTNGLLLVIKNVNDNNKISTVLCFNSENTTSKYCLGASGYMEVSSVNYSEGTFTIGMTITETYPVDSFSVAFLQLNLG